MPIYTYSCDECGHEADEFQFMQDAVLTECPNCHQDQYRKRPALPHSDMIEFSRPIEMYSIACNTEEEIQHLQKSVPGLTIETNPASEMWGVPVAATRKQKLAALAAVGYVEKS